ncbi:MAG: imelysin family protein [Cellulophaga sp.]
MKNLKLNFVGAILVSTALLSCSSDDENPTPDVAADYAAEITNVANNIIIETYKTLNGKAAKLETAVNNFVIGDNAKFEDVKTAWREARVPWEQSEGFLYGPVDSEGIDPAIDSWPVDVTAINTLLNGGSPITSTVLATNNNTRGFHTMEYFIWGLDGFKSANDLTERDVEYLMAATVDFKSKTQELYDGWVSGGGNYVANFINAGKSGSKYTSHAVALTEFVDGMITIANEVGTGKIETPLNGASGSAAPEEEESRFSHNSKVDFANNMRSIQNVYLGDYGAIVGLGLTDIVAELDAEMDAEIKNKIAETIAKIEAIPGTFTNAIENDRSDVAAAQEAVKSLEALLNSKLKPLIEGIK